MTSLFDFKEQNFYAEINGNLLPVGKSADSGKYQVSGNSMYWTVPLEEFLIHRKNRIVWKESRDGTRKEMLGDQNCQSANNERSKQHFCGPHLSD